MTDLTVDSTARAQAAAVRSGEISAAELLARPAEPETTAEPAAFLDAPAEPTRTPWDYTPPADEPPPAEGEPAQNP